MTMSKCCPVTGIQGGFKATTTQTSWCDAGLVLVLPFSHIGPV